MRGAFATSGYTLIYSADAGDVGSTWEKTSNETNEQTEAQLSPNEKQGGYLEKGKCVFESASLEP